MSPGSDPLGSQQFIHLSHPAQCLLQGPLQLPPKYKEKQEAASGPGVCVVCGQELYLFSVLADGLVHSKIQLKEEG